MSTIEVKLLSRMVNLPDITEVFNSGLRSTVFEDPLNRFIFEFMMDYFQRSALAHAPTWVVMQEEYPQIVLDTEVEETTEWLVSRLKHRYAANQAQSIIRDAAKDSATDPMGSLTRMWQKAYEAAQSVVPRTTFADMTTDVEERRQRYTRDSLNHTLRGIPIGLPEIDEHTRGIVPGELAAVAAFTKVGKAQPLSARIATPRGWIAMGELSVGDQILGSDGGTQTVTGIFDRGQREVWEVHTSSHVVVETCGEHLWAVNDRRKGGASVVLTTEELAGEVRISTDQNRPRYRLPSPRPALYEEMHGALPLDAYLLGLLLGDGGMTRADVVFTNPEIDLHYEMERRLPAGAYLRKRNSRKCLTTSIVGHAGVNPVTRGLRELGLQGRKSVDKFIPAAYKYSSVEDRVLLVQGMLDTDGTIQKGGHVELSTSSLRMAQDFREVVQSLGGTATFAVRRSPRYQTGVGQTAYRVGVRLPREIIPFLCSGPKIARLKVDRRDPVTSIVDIRRTGRFAEMRCIAVSNSDRLYRTEGHVLTHNSWLLAQSYVNALRVGLRPVMFTLEMDIPNMEDRIDCLWSGVSYQRMSNRSLDFQESARLHAAQDELAALEAAPLARPERGDRTITYMTTRARQLGADLLIVDQLSWIDADRTYSGDSALRMKHGELISELKEEIGRPSVGELPCLMAVQLNRQVMRGDNGGRGEMHNLANSSMIEQTCDVVLGLWRNNEMAANHSMVLDIMGSRRCDRKSWTLAWHLNQRTEISVREEYVGDE